MTTATILSRLVKGGRQSIDKNVRAGRGETMMIRQGNASTRTAYCATMVMGLGMAGALGSSGAYAQVLAAQSTAESDAGGSLQEIIVTDRRRAESLQQVPISITAIDQDA